MIDMLFRVVRIIYMAVIICAMFVLSRRTSRDFPQKPPPPEDVKAVALMAEGNQRMRLFIRWLRSHPDPRVRNDPDVCRLVSRWDAHKTFIRPIPPSVGVAAYTRNKGSDLRLCVPDDEMEAKDYNTMTFVLVHELAHIASSTNHHNTEFKKNFGKLLDLAIQSGIYSYQDFPTRPGSFCGTAIHHTPAARPQTFFSSPVLRI